MSDNKFKYKGDELVLTELYIKSLTYKDTDNYYHTGYYIGTYRTKPAINGLCNQSEIFDDSKLTISSEDNSTQILKIKNHEILILRDTVVGNIGKFAKKYIIYMNDRPYNDCFIRIEANNLVPVFLIN